jgi:hypothetical protein
MNHTLFTHTKGWQNSHKKWFSNNCGISTLKYLHTKDFTIDTKIFDIIYKISSSTTATNLSLDAMFIVCWIKGSNYNWKHVRLMWEFPWDFLASGGPYYETLWLAVDPMNQVFYYLVSDAKIFDIIYQLSPLLECDPTVCLPEKGKVTRGLAQGWPNFSRGDKPSGPASRKVHCSRGNPKEIPT